MKQGIRNIIPPLMVLSSMLLLLLFQFFWLQSAYQEEKAALIEDTNQYFKETLRSQQDSMLRKAVNIKFDFKMTSPNHLQMKHFLDTAFDTSFNFVGKSGIVDQLDISTIMVATDSSSINNNSGVKFKVSKFKRQQLEENLTNFLVLTLQDRDSLAPTLLKIEEDSLDIAALKMQYQTRLHEANIDLPFEIVRLNSTEQFNASAGGFATTPIIGDIPRIRHYLAHFPSYEWFVFGKISSQILFSIFLLSITSISFFLIYHNLHRQKRLAVLKNDLISNITHELKTPITTVSVAIEALHNFNALQDPEKTKDYLDISKNELNRLSILVDKVLKMAVFEQKEPELKLEPIDLKNLIQEILGSMKLQFEKFAAKVQFKWEGQDFKLSADRIHITSVIYNLIENALKYSKEQPIIQLELANTGRQLTFSVEDNGVGIAPEYQNRIFDKFFRIPTGNEHNVKGHGLGLSYVASVVQKHQGTIRLQSTVGEGSRFSINLPIENEQV